MKLTITLQKGSKEKYLSAEWDGGARSFLETLKKMTETAADIFQTEDFFKREEIPWNNRRSDMCYDK